MSVSQAIPLEVAREIARQGEMRLNALLATGTAADLRATALCGIFGTGFLGIGTATLANISSGQPSSPLVLAGSVTAFMLLISTITAAFSSAPRDFYVSGGNPDLLRQWAWDGRAWRTEVELLDATGVRQAEMIADDMRCLARAARHIYISMWIALAAPIVGITAYAIARCFA